MKEEIRLDLEKMFIEEYDFVNRVRGTINGFFTENKIDFQYDYDQFCKEMLGICDKYNIEVLNMIMVPVLINEMILSKCPDEKRIDSKQFFNH